MPVSSDITYTKNGDDVWVLDLGQDDYDVKKELMAEFGNCGVCLLRGEDTVWVIRVFELKYPHITLTFS